MSVESVKARCLKNYSSMDIALLERDIQKHVTRFEKITKTAYNESNANSFYKNSADFKSVKNEYFEKHKTEFINDYLGMLIDLFDYKPKTGA